MNPNQETSPEVQKAYAEEMLAKAEHRKEADNAILEALGYEKAV